MSTTKRTHHHHSKQKQTKNPNPYNDLSVFMIWDHVCSYLWLHEAGGGWEWAKVGRASLGHPDTVVLRMGAMEKKLLR